MPLDDNLKAVRLTAIAELVSGQIVGNEDVVVTGASSLTEAGPGDLAYVAEARFDKPAKASRAAAFVVSRPIPDLRAPQIAVDHPAYAFARIVQHFFCAVRKARGVAAQIVQGEEVSIGRDASIWPFVTLGDRVRIGDRVTLFPGVFIGEGSSIGDDTVVYPNVAILEGTSIGSRVVIHSGSVIGSDGFGYVQHQGRHHKIPQIGTVTIEDDVELGANVTVDRATFGRTVIQRGTKVDNLVQIAHNVSIGAHSILVAQVGIAGSTTLGNYVIIGGQVGIADHLTVGDQAMIAAQSGVAQSVESKQIVSGTPAIPHQQWLKAQGAFSRLPELRQHLRELEQRVRQLESRTSPVGPKTKARKQ